MFKFILVSYSLLVLAVSPAFGQQEDDGYQQELSYGINFNTIGGLVGGGMVKSTHHLRDKWYHFGSVEVVEIKHPKEQRFFNQESGGFFVYGKQNYLFAIRPSYGREYVLFRKAPESGVQVNAIFAAGPTIGLQVPYMINYNYGAATGNASLGIRVEQYDPSIHKDLNRGVMGSAGLFSGFNQLTIKPGVHLKSGLSFEYGRYREGVTGVETGVVLEMYPSRPIIIPEASNNSIFTSFYLTIYYGRRK